jgi:CubicO group peptidase (beta-lactamase class C family)
MLALAVSACAPAAAATEVTEAELARCFAEQNARVPFSGVAVAERGRRRFERTAGSLDPEGRVPVRADARFRLASVGKVLTRVAIGRLVQSGRVDLAQSVRTYLPELPETFAPVTVEQLLQHRSGVASLTRLSPDLIGPMTGARTARELVALVASRPIEFAAGAREQYSNGGFLLLGAIVEAVSGTTYEAFLDREILRPLGMRSTGLVAGPRAAVPLTSMSERPGPPLATPRALTETAVWRGTAAGDAVSSAADLVRLGRALLGDRLLSPAVKLRLFPRSGEGPWRIGQSGGGFGINTDFAVYPESGWIVAVLSNRDPPAGQIMGEVLRTLVAGGGCRTLGEEDRPSPFRRPQPGQGGR